MKNILVFFGGESVERDVSIITGLITLNSLSKEKFNAVPVYVHTDGGWYTGKNLADIDEYKNLNINALSKVSLIAGSNEFNIIKGKKIKKMFPIACAVNCMHGGSGENGALAGLLELHKIPLASPSTLASAICMDKECTKLFLKGMGINVLAFKAVGDVQSLDKLKVKFPVIVKPNSLGSSVGVSVANNREQLVDAVAMALRFDEKVLIEPKLEGFTEINCAAYASIDEVVVSDCEKPMGSSDVLYFDDKYSSGRRQFPARIDKDIANKIKTTTAKIYSALNCNGIIRIDYFIDVNKKVWVNEINTVPGSMAYYLFCEKLSEFSKLLESLIVKAERDYAKKSTLVTKFSTSLLSMGGTKGAKRL